MGQLFRFGITGLINTIIDFGIFNFLLYISGVHSSIYIGLINILSVTIAAINSFFLNRNWTFDNTEKRPLQIPRFFLATAAGMLLNSLIVTVAASLASAIPLPYYLVINLAKVLASILSATWNFFSYKYWVFPGREVEKGPELQPGTPGLVSVIVPAYNEENRLPARLESLANSLPNFFPVEIVVVDDGSTDKTLNIAHNLAEKYPVIRCLYYSPNQGKGKAVQTGMQEARGEYLLYTDADDTFTADHIQAVVKKLKTGHDIVIACREATSGQRLKGESRLRQIMGRSLNLLVQVLLLPGIDDTQCGLKGFHREPARKIFSRQTLKRFAFDIEILALARALHFQIEKLSVTATACAGSKVNCWLSPLQMSWDLLKLKANFFTNRYALPDGNKTMLQFTLALSLFSAALAVRLPYLWEVPRFIDELKEVNLGYLIYSGQALPLHNMAHDIGALHNYILAAIFKFFGPNIYLPRLYVAITAALTVVLLYYLGRQLYDHRTALLAAGLLLTNGMHMLVTHMAWSNCTTPFFFTIALIATITAEQRKSGRWLVAAGLLWALALQTHSSVIIYVLVTIIYVMHPEFRRRTNIHLCWYRRSAIALIAGYANMICYNIMSLGGSFRWLKHKSYALESELNLQNYLDNCGNLLIELLKTLSSTYAAHDSLGQYLHHPTFLGVTILLLAGIYLSRKQPINLSLWLLVGGILIIPLVNQRYAFYVSTRYIMPLVICSLLLLSRAAIQCFITLQSHGLPEKARTLLITSTLLVIPFQLFPFYNYCNNLANTNASNRMALNILTLASSPSPALIIIEDQLPLENDPLPYLLTLKQQPFEILPLAANSNLANYWDRYLKNYDADNLVAVMNDSTFKQMQELIAPSKVNCLNCKVIIPNPSKTERKIYVIEIKK